MKTLRVTIEAELDQWLVPRGQADALVFLESQGKKTALYANDLGIMLFEVKEQALTSSAPRVLPWARVETLTYQAHFLGQDTLHLKGDLGEYSWTLKHSDNPKAHRQALQAKQKKALS